MKCPICKHGETQPGTTTATLERDGMAVVFRGVPGEVCDNCGETFHDEAVTASLLRQPEQADAAEPEGGDDSVRTIESLLRDFESECGDFDWDAFDKGVDAARRLERVRNHLPHMIRGALPDFGLHCLSITEAASLVVADRRASQGLESINSGAAVKKDVQAEVEKFLNVLAKEITCGTLRAETVRKTWEGAIDPDRTFIDIQQLWHWLDDRCHTPGRFIEVFIESERNRRDALMAHAERLRFRDLSPTSVFTDECLMTPEEASECSREDLEADHARLQSRLLAVTEAARKAQAAAKDEALSSPRRRKSYEAVIEGLAKKLKLDLTQHGAAQQITDWVALAGRTVGRDTVSSILKQMNENRD